MGYGLPMVNVSRRLLGLVVPLVMWPGALAACGGASGPASDGNDAAQDGAEAGPVAGSPAAECLAIASAERAAKPDEPISISVKHILVKHGAGASGRSRGEACLRALQARDALAAGTDFDQVVADYSDEPGAATRGGTLGAITRDQVDPAFADGAFALEIDQVSHVVESKSGFHVIFRVE